LPPLISSTDFRASTLATHSMRVRHASWAVRIAQSIYNDVRCNHLAVARANIVER
jgi:hypothetical protein